MVKKAVWRVRAVAQRVLFLALSVQILLGLVWAVSAIGGFQEYEESYRYLEASKTLLVDEYTGILYPFLLWLLRGVCNVLPFSYTAFLFPMQLLCGFLAGFFFLKKAGNALKIGGASTKGESRTLLWIWGSLVLLTVPVGMQCHLAVLPISPATSCFLAQWGCFLSVKQKKEGKTPVASMLFCGLFWVLESLLWPVCFWPGLVIGICLAANKDYGKKPMAVGIGALVGTLLLGVLTATPGSMGRNAFSVEEMLFERTVCYDNEFEYTEWPSELLALLDESVVFRVYAFPEERANYLCPVIENRFGREQAKKYELEMAKICLDEHKTEIFKEILWDGAGYVLPSVIVSMQLQKKGYASFTPRNVDAFRSVSPFWGKLYLNWFLWGCLPLLLLGVLLFFLSEKKKGTLLLPGVFGGILLSAVLCTRASGTMDYKYSMLWLTICFLPAVLGSVSGLFKREEENQ